jgi:hypothetical protein
MNRLHLLILIGLISGLPGTVLSYASMTSPIDNSLFYKNYFIIQNVQVEEIDESPAYNPPIKCFSNLKEIASFDFAGGIQDAVSGTSAASLVLDNIINFGKNFWALIEANKAIVNITSDRANAIPQGISSWEHMQEWKAPNSRLFHVTYTNFFGMNVVDFTFRLIYTYGGTVNGKGHYLTQIGVIPAELLVRSGYAFNVNVSVPSITNAGTSESPMAAAEILVSWSLDNYAKHIEGSQSFYIRGDGYFENMSGKLDPLDPVDKPNSSGANADLYGETDPFSDDSYSTFKSIL